MTARRLVLIGSLCIPFAAGTAQDRAPIAPATRIRYWPVRMSKPVEAYFVLLAPDSLRIQSLTLSDTLTLPLSGLRRLEVLRGPDDHATLGAGVGAFVGAVVGSFAFQHGSHDSGAYQRDIIRGYIFAVVCGVLGALFGSTLHSFHWEAVPIT